MTNTSIINSGYSWGMALSAGKNKTGVNIKSNVGTFKRRTACDTSRDISPCVHQRLGIFKHCALGQKHTCVNQFLLYPRDKKKKKRTKKKERPSYQSARKKCRTLSPKTTKTTKKSFRAYCSAAKASQDAFRLEPSAPPPPPEISHDSPPSPKKQKA